MDSERQIQKKKNLRKLIKLKDTHKDFVQLGLDDETSAAAERAGKDPSDITDTFKMKLWTRIQVDAGYKWWVYRDGVFYDELDVGPHILWNTNIFGKWQVLRINLQTIPLKLVVDGRLKGPSLPEGTAGEANAELALTGRAVYNVWCKIDTKKIETFLVHSAPIDALYHIMNHTVNTIRPKYSYDQYGQWANELAQELEYLLSKGPKRTEHMVGLKVLKVYHDLDESNTLHDQQAVQMFEHAQKHLH